MRTLIAPQDPSQFQRVYPVIIDMYPRVTGYGAGGDGMGGKGEAVGVEFTGGVIHGTPGVKSDGVFSGGLEEWFGGWSWGGCRGETINLYVT